MPSSTTPESFFTHTIQLPARGSAVTLPENSPTTTSSAVMPRENTNRYTNPNTPLRVVATHVSTAANAGAPHGAATPRDVGEGEPGGAGARRLPGARPGEDPRGNGDHRVDAGRQTRDESRAEQGHQGDERAMGQRVGEPVHHALQRPPRPVGRPDVFLRD